MPNEPLSAPISRETARVFVVRCGRRLGLERSGQPGQLVEAEGLLEDHPIARLAAPAHSHDHYEETIYGIEGVLTWTVDGKRVDVGPGQALCIPRAPFTGSTTPAART